MDWSRILAPAIAGLSGGLRRKGKRRTRRPWPANLAHRGASWRAPENTLEAFRLAFEEGSGGLELDLRMTRDGELAVIHDATVDRTTNGSGAVAELTLDDLRGLDAGYRFSLDGGQTFPYRGRGLKIPTLAQVYERFPDAHVNADIKEARPGAEEAVFRVIRRAAAEARTLVASTDHAVLERFRRVSGGRVSTGASRREIAAFYLLSRAGLEALVHPAYDALQVPVEQKRIELLTPRFVKAAHARGVRVDAWTINDPREMRRLLDLGVDVVMTDRPGVLAGLLEERRGER